MGIASMFDVSQLIISPEMLNLIAEIDHFKGEDLNPLPFRKMLSNSYMAGC